jgi:hypothetical protein
MKRIVGSIAAIVLAVTLQAQTAKTKPAATPDKQDVDKLCGCFDVEFKYAETFSPDRNYKFHDRDEISGGTEYIFAIESTDKRIVMQHLLVISDDMIIKHWRENWTYEDSTIWKYQGDKVWTKQSLTPAQSKGKWFQSVWEVSDAPRYQGGSEWITTDNKTSWENTADAPLPRREYSVRDDYNILKRNNRIVLTADGWIHEQNNQKIIRKDGTDKLLTEERGLNTYKRIDDSKCAAAKAYWEKNKTYWTKVRTTWENYLATHNSIELQDKIDGKVLHDNLFAQAKDFADGKIKPTDIDAQIKGTIEKYLGKTKDIAGTN